MKLCSSVTSQGVHICFAWVWVVVLGQNGSGQNGTDKMVYGQNGIWTKWYTDKMSLDKMVWTKWYGQNGTNKTVPIKSIKYQSRSHCQYDFFINPASTLIPLHFL